MNPGNQHIITLTLLSWLVIGLALPAEAQLFQKKKQNRFPGTYVGYAIARIVRVSDGHAIEKRWDEYSFIVTKSGEGTYTLELLVSWRAMKVTKSRLELPKQTQSVPELKGPFSIYGGEASFYANCVNAGMTGSSGNYSITLSFNGCEVDKKN